MSQTLFYILLFSGVISFVYLAWSQLPTAEEMPLPEAIRDAFELIAGFMRMFEFIIPFNTLVTILQWAIAFHFALFIYKRFWWAIKLLRGSGTTGT